MVPVGFDDGLPKKLHHNTSTGINGWVRIKDVQVSDSESVIIEPTLRECSVNIVSTGRATASTRIARANIQQ